MNMNIIDMKISEINIENRHRKDMGDLETLAHSIEEVGLLHPIGITPEHELIFGERRLRAYRDVMQRETIPARIVAVESVLLGQIAETIVRKNFTITERLAIVDALRSFNHGGDRRSEQILHSENESLTLDEACKRVGFSKDSYYRAKEVEEKGVPDLIRAMDSQKLSVIAAKELAQAEPEEQRECMKRRFDGDKLTARSVKKQLRRIRNRKKRDEALARAVQQVDKQDSIQIHHCPFQELEQSAGIESESVQLVCTDIPYGNEFLDQIGDLAAFSKRVLVSGGLLVAYLGQHRFNEKLEMLDDHLKFQWLNSSVWKGVGNVYSRLNIVSKSIPIVVYSKGQWTPRTRWVDTYVSQVQEKNWHPWQRPLNEVERLVQYFSNPGDLVVDPCGGGFTTAIACLRNHRRFIGSDIDKAAVVKGQERLAEEWNGQITPPMKEITINSVTEGDCRHLIPSLPDGSVSLALTSPPYAEQRKGLYPGVPADEYPGFTVEWMSSLWDKLTDDGSVIIVIRPHLKRGVISDFVLRTRLALRGFGWKECEKLMWLKEDGGGCMGSNKRPRRTYEEILWFSKTHDPFIDTKACGRWSDNITFRGSTRFGIGGESPVHADQCERKQSGQTRVADVISVPMGAIAKGVQHPAMFPIPLAEKLIQTLCPPDGVVLDPFAGSGSTLLAAKSLGHPFFGFDIMAEYVEIARKRLGEVEPPSLPQAG